MTYGRIAVGSFEGAQRRTEAEVYATTLSSSEIAAKQELAAEIPVEQACSGSMTWAFAWRRRRRWPSLSRYERWQPARSARQNRSRRDAAADPRRADPVRLSSQRRVPERFPRPDTAVARASCAFVPDDGGGNRAADRALAAASARRSREGFEPHHHRNHRL